MNAAGKRTGVNEKRRNALRLLFLSLCFAGCTPNSCDGKSDEGIEAPALSGSLLTNDPRPTWTWTGPVEAVGYLVRIVELETEAEAHSLTAAETSYRPAAGLGAGTYTLGVRSVGSGSGTSSTETFFATTIVTPRIAEGMGEAEFTAAYGGIDAFGPGAGGTIGLEYSSDDLLAMLEGFLFKDTVPEGAEFRYGKNDVTGEWLFLYRHSGEYAIYQIAESDYHAIDGRDPYSVI
jgi:hypothetical protein